MALSKDICIDLSAEISKDLSGSGAAAATPAVLLQHWEFNEGAGTTVAAATGVAGTLNSAAWATGIVGSNAADLNLNQVVSDSLLTFGTNKLSFAFWLNPTGAPADGSAMSFTTKNAPYIDFNFASGKLRCAVSGIVGSITEEMDTAIFADQWQHIVVVVDNSTTRAITFYLNGIAQSSTTISSSGSGGPIYPDSVVRLGATGTSDWLADDFRIYSGELTANQINALILLAPTVFQLVEGVPFVMVEGELLFI